MNVIAFDRRARHRVVSDPSALDVANDVDADAQEAIVHLARAHFLALGAGDAQLVRELNTAGRRLVHLRRRLHEGLDLLNASVEVDPYLAVQYGGGTDAA